MTATITVQGVEVPFEVRTLEGFRRWIATLGENGPHASFCDGKVHVEMTPHDYRTHEPIVAAVGRVLPALADETGIGRYFAPPSWLTDAVSGISTEPDGFFVRWDSFKSGRVRINPERATELLGPPDMALEVVSKTSAKKDLEDLYAGYARAGVSEYWLIDARGERLEFRLHVLGADGTWLPSAADADGWLVSPTWARKFKLEPFVNPAGLADCRLLVRR